MTYLKPRKFSLLMIDKNQLPKNTDLVQLLKRDSFQYCILLNTTSKDIQSVKEIYRQSTPTRFIRTSTTKLSSFLVLSKTLLHTNQYPTPPPNIRWLKIKNNWCALIKIQGVNFLFVCLGTQNRGARKALLGELETYTLKDGDGKNVPIHFLSVYLDPTQSKEQDILTFRYGWQYLYPTHSDADIYNTISFHTLINVAYQKFYHNISSDLKTIDTTFIGLQLQPSSGISLKIKCNPMWHIDLLNHCYRKDHLDRNPQ